jgi:hypothetical protein
VARPGQSDNADAVLYTGEIWTDGRGYATVNLPRSASRPHGALEYEVRALVRGVTAAIAAELIDGRFTIETDEPHVKVAWRVSERRRHPRMEEEQQ